MKESDMAASIDKATRLHKRAKQLGIVTFKDGVPFYQNALDRLEADIAKREAELGAAVISSDAALSERDRRDITIAALKLVGCSYGQILALTPYKNSTIYQAIAKRIPLHIRQQIPKTNGKPLISHEQATACWEIARNAPHFSDPLMLAQYIQAKAKEQIDTMDGEDD